MPIALNHASYCYDPGTPFAVSALDDLSLTIHDGEWVGIMGQTGCGKSTLLQLLAGLVVPTAGQVLLDGQDIHDKRFDRRILRQRVGVVFQYPEAQLFESTVEKDVAFSLRHSGLSKTQIRERVQRALERMGFSFDKVRSLPPLALSGGEKRRVAIAGVLAAEPDILLFDEPVAGLDGKARQSFLEMVSGLHREGVTILMVSHHADSLCEYADRMVVLSEGRIALDGTPRAVFADKTRTDALQIGAGSVRWVAEQLALRGLPVDRETVRYNALLDALCTHLQGGASG